MAAPNPEIQAHVDQLRRLLASLGPVDKIKDAELRTSAQLLNQVLAFIDTSMTGTEPDEAFQRRMVKAAQQEWHQLTLLRQIVPTLKAKKDFADAATRTAAQRKVKAAQRDASLKAEAEKIRRTNPNMSVTDVAKRLSERNKLGGAEAIRKKLSRLLRN